ncbi:MAG: DUF480 domain-containing protein [Planctomycetota bacterium]
METGPVQHSGNQSEPLVLSAMERRILGVLIEKALTTPNQYPLSLNAIVTGSNQKSNRDPVVSFMDEPVFDCLSVLGKKHLVSSVYPAGGRTEKYRQELTDYLELTGPEKAVIGELLLRGAQSVGELRQRASRMVRIEGLAELDEVLRGLIERDFPLVVRLTSPGIKRGVRVTHNLYEPGELDRVRSAEPEEGEVAAPRAAAPPASAPPGVDVAALVAQVQSLEARVSALEARLP